MNTVTEQATCPFTGRRRTHRPGEATLPDAPRVEVIDGVWHIRSLPTAKEILQAGRTTEQAGFSADHVSNSKVRRPILYGHGEEHRTQRAKLARYFAPRTVDRRYRDFMETRADEIVARLAEYGRAGDVELGDATMRFSVEVAAQVLGLGEANMPGMSRRMERFFGMPLLAPGNQSLATKMAGAFVSLKSVAVLGDFFRKDVKPAIEARREHPQEDVISHCIEEGYSDEEILIEAVTYGAAGMVTTREFLVVAAWHLLDDPVLFERYMADLGPEGEKERYAILEEILRLEPVVGHLLRRATEPMTVHDGEVAHEIPAGAVLNLYIRAANADPEHVGGPDPIGVCPQRDLPPRVGGEVLSFGDGAHKCPGQHVAIQESDIFLTRLLQLPLEITSQPSIEWAELIQGYELRGLTVRVRNDH